jgi:putative ABC transport system permease protein
VSTDIRIAVRRIRRSPGLAAAIVLTLALGLGAATAILTVTRATLIGRLPYPAPDRLVEIHEQRPATGEQTPTSYATLEELRHRTTVYASLEGYDGANFIVGAADGARMVHGAEITTGFFRTLGFRTLAGRDFANGEDAPGYPSIAIVTDRFARATGIDRAGVARIVVNGVPRLVVGILPSASELGLLQDADVFTPLVVDDARRTDRGLRTLTLVARLKPNVSMTQAQRDLAAVMSQLEREFPDALRGRIASITPLRDAVIGGVRPIVTSLLVAVALLLVIVAANLGLLMLSRYVERIPELTMRAALGATRGRLLRQLLVETMLPSAIGAAAAIIAGQALTTAMLATIPDGVKADMPYLLNTQVDARVIAAIVVLALVLANLFGVVPGFLITRRDLKSAGSRTTSGRDERRVRRALVAAQLALTVVLLTSAGILFRSLNRLVHRDVGVQDPGSLVSVRIPLSGPRYAEDARQQAFYQEVLNATGTVAGIRSIGMIDEVPGGGSGSTTFQLSDHPLPSSMQTRAMRRVVGGAYFATMGARVIAGRVFDARDRAGSPDVVVVSRKLARLIEQDGRGPAVGRLLQFARTGKRVWQVIGVVDEIQVVAWDADTPPVAYFPHLQEAENRMTLVLRTSLPLTSVANNVRAIVARLDPGVPVYGAVTLARQMSNSSAVFRRRFPLVLSGVFALAALALTLIAMYAISMHEVTTRERELGVRAALGASPATLRGLIASDAMRLMTAGVGIGLMLAALSTRFLQALVFEVSTRDVGVYAAVTLAMVVAALLVSIAPILRAGRVSPSIVTRAE